MKTLIGLFLCLFSVAAFASTFVAGTELGHLGVSPLAIVFLRFAFAGSLITALVSRSHEGRVVLFKKPTLRDWLGLAAVGIIGTSLMSYCIFKASALVPSTNASMSDALTPLIIFSICAIMNRKARIWQIFGAIVGFVGAAVVNGFITCRGIDFSSFSLGDFFVLGGASTWALYTVWGRPLVEKFGSTAFSAATMVFGALSCVPFLFFCDVHWPLTWRTAMLVGYICVVPTLGAFWARNAAHKYISMSVLGMTGYFTPVFAMIISYFWFGDKFNALQIAGVIGVCFSALVEVKGNEQ